jgi:DNA polymerase-3 subunit delta
MEYNEIITELKSKIYRPVYFLEGEEPYFIDKITAYIQENVLNEAEKSFNQTILYGKDTTIEDVINTAKRFPMMANNQVVIVKEAQNLNDLKQLGFYIQSPQKSTILVINYKYKSLDKRSKLYKTLKDKAVFFESKKIPEYKIAAWITKYLKNKNTGITDNAAELLAEYLGNDLNKITHELDKLFLTLPKDKDKITPDDIEKNIGISKDYNAFELNKALADKDVLKANRIVNHFAKNPNENPLPKTVGSLYYFFSKVLGYHFVKNVSNQKVLASSIKINPKMVWQYKKAAQKYDPNKLARIISYLREYDMKSKGMNNVSTPDGELLRELVFKILH